MRGLKKKICGVVLAAACLTSSIALTACKDGAYVQNPLAGYTTPQTAATSNGGFSVVYGDYVYFINGLEKATASNTFGEVKKGALMRISKTQFENGEYSKAETVVPMLFVAQNFHSGIYIYGDYVYYATPTTDKNLSGDVENSWIDFKRAKLDGSETMRNYYFRLEDNAAEYRFVQNTDGVVYCLYEEDGALKSYNTSTGVHTTLVSGAKSSFYYDTQDLTNPAVYYTMEVQMDIDTDKASTAKYDQLYRVTAFDTVTSMDASKATYTTSSGNTYDFDESYLQRKNEEAEENDTAQPYNLSDYTTYPYVNLGALVLDGIGTNYASKTTQFNEHTQTTPTTVGDGYTYSIKRYQNGGVYFTRTELTTTSSSATNTQLYYLAETDAISETWNTVDGNAESKLDVVALDTTNASDNAIFYMQNDEHYYLYLSSDKSMLMKAGAPDQNGNVEEVKTYALLESVTLWTLEGDYLYYYAAGTNGNKLSRINYTGTQAQYNQASLIPDQDEYDPLDEYRPLTIAGVDFTSNWYKPEMIDDVLVYANAQALGDSSYNYIYATKLGTTEQLKADSVAYQAVESEIEEYEDDKDIQAVMQYYFCTGETTLYEAVESLYSSTQKTEIENFIKKFSAETDALRLQNTFLKQLGSMKAEDVEKIAQGWQESLKQETEDEEEESGLPTYAIVLISVGGALAAAAIVVTVCLVVSKKKKAKAEAEAEATVNAYKRKKIDTTDDKSIDVYADDANATENTENTEDAASTQTPAAEESAQQDAPAQDVQGEGKDEE